MTNLRIKLDFHSPTITVVFLIQAFELFFTLVRIVTEIAGGCVTGVKAIGGNFDP